MMERPFRPPSFQFQGDSLFSRTAESTLTPTLNQQATVAFSSTTDQSTSEQRSQSSDENLSVSVSGDQEDSGRETASITESVVFSAQGHPASSSRPSSSTNSLITAGAGLSGNKRTPMSRARPNLGGYQGVTVEVRYDENADGIEGGASYSRTSNAASGNRNTIGTSGAEMTGRPMAFPPASQDDDDVSATTNRNAGGDVNEATERSMGTRERKVNLANPIARLMRRGPQGNGSPRL